MTMTPNTPDFEPWWLDGEVTASPEVSAQLGALLRGWMRAHEYERGMKFHPEVWQFANRMGAVRSAIRREVDLKRRGGLELVDTGGLEVGKVGSMTISQTAGRLGVTAQAVQRRIDRGTLPAAKDGRGRWLIPEDAVDEAARAKAEAEPLSDSDLVYAQIRAYRDAMAVKIARINLLLGQVDAVKQEELLDQLGEAWLSNCATAIALIDLIDTADEMANASLIGDPA